MKKNTYLFTVILLQFGNLLATDGVIKNKNICEKFSFFKNNKNYTQLDYNFLTPDSLWQKKIKQYTKSKNSYFRTYIVTNRIEFKSFLNERFKPNEYNVTDISCKNCFYVEEFFNNDYSDVVYKIINESQSKLISNYKNSIGLENDILLNQRIDKDNYLSNRELKILNINSSENIKLKYLTNTSFEFDRLKVFPFLRIGYPDFLFSQSTLNRGARYPLNLENSDLLFSLKNQTIHCIQADEFNKYFIEFSASNSFFKLNNIIYDKSDLSIINTPFSQSDNNGQNSSNILAFNDSTFIAIKNEIHSGDEEKNNQHSPKLYVYNINRKTIDSLIFEFFINENLFDEITLNRTQIDMFSDFVYSEIKCTKTIKDRMINKDYLVIHSINTGQIVYIGPNIGIDYISEKSGFAFTKAENKVSNILVKDLQMQGDKAISKMGLNWRLINVNSNLKNTNYLEKKQTYFSRYLLDFNCLMNDSFVPVLNEKIQLNIANYTDDVFSNVSRGDRKFFIFDSLILVGYNWINDKNLNSGNLNFSLSYKEDDTLGIKKFVNLINNDFDIKCQENINMAKIENYKVKLINVERKEVRLRFSSSEKLVFDLVIDSFQVENIDMQNLQINGQRDVEFIDIETGKFQNAEEKLIVNVNNVTNILGGLKISANDIIILDSNYCKIKFQIYFETDERSIKEAKQFKDDINDGIIRFSKETFEINQPYLLELFLIDSFHNSDNMANNNYMFELKRNCDEQGISNVFIQWKLKYDEDWINQMFTRNNAIFNGIKFPILMSTNPKLKFTSKF